MAGESQCARLKKVKIYIDQSGKVEYTSKNTVVAFSNGKQKSILIKARDKREIQRFFREAGKPDIFVYKTFAILIYLLIADELKEITGVVIDTEYVGKEFLIKNFLMQIFQKRGIGFSPQNISFFHAGKKHLCHVAAIETYRKAKKPDVVINLAAVLKNVF